MSGRSGIDMKFDRARYFADQLAAEAAGYMSSGALAWEPLDSDRTKVVLRIREAPPIGLSLLAGDAVHNARSALDHLAWRLVELGGGTPGTHTQFPISAEEQGFGATLKSRLKGASLDVRQSVRALRPWRGGDPHLYDLTTMDNWDKHRLLLAVASRSELGLHVSLDGVPQFDIGIVGEGWEDAKDGDIESVPPLLPEVEWGPEVREGAIQVQNSLQVAVAFARHTPCAGRRPDIVARMIEHVATAVEPLVAQVA